MDQPHDAPDREAPGQGGAPHVLIVDDDADIREVVELIFIEDGCSAITCATSKAALAILQAQHVNLLVTDLRLPGGDGANLIRYIAAMPEPRPGIILLTAMRTLDALPERATLQALGGRVIAKPFDVDMLLAIGRELTGWPGAGAK